MHARKNGSVPKDPAAAAETAGGKPTEVPLATPIAIVDLGHESSRLLVCSSRGLWVRNLGFGGQLLTRALVKEFNVTIAQAEQYKRNPLAAPSVAQVYRAVGPAIAGLAE